MKIYYVDRVTVSAIEKDGSYTCHSLDGRAVYDKCRFVRENPNNRTYERLGEHALILSIDGRNFILGYYDPSLERSSTNIYVEGEHIMMAGEGKALIMGEEGYIGVYYIQCLDDGTVEKIPKFEISVDDDVYLSYNSLLQSMADSSVRQRIEKDDLGFNVMELGYKGRGDDLGCRYRSSVKGGLTGISKREFIDLMPTPKRVSPEPVDVAVTRLETESSAALPLQILFSLAAIPTACIKIKLDGSIDIMSGPSLSMAVISLSSTGKITIEGRTGVDICGGPALLSLADTIKSFITTFYQTHTHPSMVGPTGPPIIPPIKTTTELTIIKGM